MATVRLVGKRVNFSGLLGSASERRSDLNQAGLKIIEQIQDRTISGRDEGNAKFRPYSPGYAKTKGVSRDAVNLYASGGMLNNLNVLDVSERGVAIGFSDGDMRGRADANEARGRKFLGVPEAWIEAIKRTLLFRRIGQGQ